MRTAPGAQAPRDLDAVDVRQPEIQQHEIGAQELGGRQALAARGALAHDVEPVGFQQRTGGATESGVIVDDENGLGHTHNDAPVGRTQKPS